MKEEEDDDKLENGENVDRPINDIKSTAVVKYAAVRTPAKFYKLQNNTDLKLPPPSWLKETSPWKVLKGHWATSSKDSSTSFTSLHMASDFPDCIGEVDVVSDSENIKKLLKIPYNKSQVSMMVHRVGKTLLLDEFDIHRHFLWASKKEWDWLHKFYLQHVLQTHQHKEKAYCREAKSRNYLQHKNMLSKFLYHSVDDQDAASDVESTHKLAYSGESSPQKAPDPWPHAFPEEESENFSHSHDFQRNVVWNFEDIRMLIGTDMPIFGGGTHPCVSLRLRDMAKPINVLTGLDYWLDNLMCNVPEVFMCYHLDGIVQKYELMKTEDIPQLKDSKFSPKVIKDVAQNILSFLKSKATKAGHTYWLFKGNDDEVVKLYDLTTLCSDVLDDGECNPFTIPVAMLLYRVARNMKLSNPDPQCQGTICHLLENCVSLLDKTKHPQVIISAHYLLSDLYMPDDLDASTLNSDELSHETRDEKKVEFETKSGSVAASAQVKVEALCLSEIGDRMFCQSDTNDPPISGTVEERCKAALSHVAQGLSCLKEHISSKTCSSPKKEDVQKMAKSFEPIPLRYSPLNAAKDTTVGTSKSGCKIHACDKKKGGRLPMTTQRQEWLCADSLLGCYARRLLLKASTTAYTFAAVLLKVGKVGSALKKIKLSLLCLECVESTDAVRSVKENTVASVVQESNLLELAGDAQFMLVQQWNGSVEGHLTDYNAEDRSDLTIAECTKEFLGKVGRHEKLVKVECGIEDILNLSCECYKQALKVNRDKHGAGNDSLKKRLGNIENELGVYYMNQAIKLYDNEENDGGQEALNKSLEHLKIGLEAFEDVQDKANMALLNSNMGRLMRTYAHSSNIHESTKALSSKERNYYEKAISCYQRALRCLGSNTNQFAEVRETVMWELSSTFYTLATLLQDYAPLSLSARPQIEVEREVSDLMNKALRYCESGITGANQHVRQYRVASIHHRLGSLYHNSCRCLVGDETRRRQQRNLAEKHYLKSATSFALLENAAEFLRVQLERVALMELQYSSLTSYAAKVKCLHGILELLFAVQSLEMDTDTQLDEELTKLLNLFKQRLQFTLHQLIKIHSGKDAPKRNDQLEIYKQMYSKSLTLTINTGLSLDQTRQLKEVIRSIEQSFQLLKS